MCPKMSRQSCDRKSYILILNKPTINIQNTFFSLFLLELATYKLRQTRSRQQRLQFALLTEKKYLASSFSQVLVSHRTVNLSFTAKAPTSPSFHQNTCLDTRKFVCTGGLYFALSGNRADTRWGLTDTSFVL